MNFKVYTLLIITTLLYSRIQAQYLEDYFGAYQVVIHSGATTADGYETCPPTEELIIDLLPADVENDFLLQLNQPNSIQELLYHVDDNGIFVLLGPKDVYLESNGHFEAEGIELNLMNEYGLCTFFIIRMEEDDMSNQEQMEEDDTNGAIPMSDEDQKKLIEYSRKLTFDSGRASLKQNSVELLDAILLIMNKYPDAKFDINGHTDSIGRSNTNERLSQSRAKSVKDYLVSKGIDPQRLNAVGYGEDQPIDVNTTRAGRAANRRIDIVLVHD